MQISWSIDDLEVNMVGESDATQVQESANTQVSDDKQISGAPKPLVIHYTRSTPVQSSYNLKPLIIQVPTHFPYKNTKVVPWKYDVQVLVNESKNDQL